MPPIYMLFDFGADEEKAQQARHRLDGWKQAFRLDKKLIFKFDRAETMASEKSGKMKARGKEGTAEEAPASNGTVKLLLRLGFSAHEKITEQRWVERIPAEEPFKSASPCVVKPGQADFAATEERFENMEKSYGFLGGAQQHPG